MIYIYIGEIGQVFCTESEPTAADFKLCGKGLLSIIATDGKDAYQVMSEKTDGTGSTIFVHIKEGVRVPIDDKIGALTVPEAFTKDGKIPKDQSVDDIVSGDLLSQLRT